MNVIRTESLRKLYGRHVALRDVSLRVEAGRLFGFLGPNGAGKTTTIRILLGLLRATSGAARIFDQDVWSDGPLVRREIGYLPGDVRLYDRLTGRATLEFFAAARRRDCADEIRRLRSLFDLDLHRRVRNYSRGMKQKLGLIQALMHRPRLVILDEPTVSLDPLVREALFEELRRVAADGRTVFFSSHTLSEVEALCDDVAILRQGRLIEQERIEVLRTRALRHVEVRFDPVLPRPPQLPDGLHVLSEHDNLLEATWTGPVAGLFDWLARVRPRDATVARPDLEDLFLAYYDGSGNAYGQAEPVRGTRQSLAGDK
jgi:ABC-2 type transport system ATP-binding protein